MTKITAKATITIEIDGQEVELSLTEARELYSQLKTILNITGGEFVPSIVRDAPLVYTTESGKQLDLWLENGMAPKLRGVETA